MKLARPSLDSHPRRAARVGLSSVLVAVLLGAQSQQVCALAPQTRGSSQGLPEGLAAARPQPSQAPVVVAGRASWRLAVDTGSRVADTIARSLAWVRALPRDPGDVATAALVADLRAELAGLVTEVAVLEVELGSARRNWTEGLERMRRDHEIELATREQRERHERAQRAVAAGQAAGDEHDEEQTQAAFDPWEEIARLRMELDAERTERIAREREWLDFTQSFARVAPESAAAVGSFSAHVPIVTAGSSQAGSPADDEADQAREQALEVRRTLRTMLALEEVRGLDLIEVERVEDGYCGPVLFRLLDDRGRLAGSLWAERLRLEGSRSGRTLALVLEDGYESHMGVRTAFNAQSDPRFHAGGASFAAPVDNESIQGGTRRITLTHVDPMPWVDRLPGLFGERDLERVEDDSLWNLDRVRLGANGLLAEDGAFGIWRIKSLGGVVDGVLRNVHLEFNDAQGRLERRVFADRLAIRVGSRGIELLLEDGAHMRGDRKAPFLDGRYRILLPRAKVEAWRAARLPGLVAHQLPGASAPAVSEAEQ